MRVYACRSIAVDSDLVQVEGEDSWYSALTFYAVICSR